MKTVKPSARSVGQSVRFIPDESPAPERDFLDDLLDQAVQALEDGRTVDPQPWFERRPDLREQIAVVLQRAGEIAAAPAVALPVVPGYVLIRRLGAGGMGAVYLARQERVAGRPIALKILPAGAALSPRARERFRAEAAAIARLRHPHIVDIYDVVDEGGVHAFAMEWVDGVSLADAIAQAAAGPESSRSRFGSAGRLSLETPASNPLALAPARVAQIGVAIGRALAAVHAAGLLHRDVKPSNILLRRDGTPLLSDFGLVRETEATITSPGHFAGTLAYAPPEQLRGEIDRLDARSDVYALGATLYHALTLRLPFAGGTPTELLRRIESGRVLAPRKLNPRIPADLQTIVLKALETEPGRRYQGAAELADDLQRLLSLQPIRARPAGVVTRAFKLARRNRAALTGATLGGLVAAGGLLAAVFWLFLVPRWSAEHIRTARLALLEPDAANHIAALVLWGADRRLDDVGRAHLYERLDQALSDYAAAARWSTLSEPLAREAAVVRAVRIGEPCPASDLRSQGLHAFLRDKHEHALATWNRWEKSRDPLTDVDPLVDTALGILQLFNNQPARAYPRLQKAAEIFPRAGFLLEYLAEAAAKSGDAVRARRWLDQSRVLPQRDAWGASARIEAVILAAEGDVPAALAVLRKCTPGPLIRLERARVLARAGRVEGALFEFQSLVGAAPLGPGVRREYLACLSQWWTSLDPAQRQSKIEAALREPPDQSGSLVSALRMCLKSARPAGHSAPQSTRLSDLLSGWRTTPAGFPIFLFAAAAIRDLISSPSLQSLSIPELAERMEVEDMPLWNHLNRLPLTVQRLVLRSWKSPVLRPMAHGAVTLRVGCTLAAALLARGALAQCDSPPCFEGLGGLTGETTFSSSTRISRDGSTVLGQAAAPEGIYAARWRSATGWQVLGDLGGARSVNRAFDSSSDGSVVVGSTFSSRATCSDIEDSEAFRWTEETGMVGLGDLPGGCFGSYGVCATSDGNNVLCIGLDDSQYRPGIWQGAGIVPIVPSPGGGPFSAYAMTPNGSFLAGTYSDGGSVMFRWSAATGFENLGDLAGGGSAGYSTDITPDGRIIVGRGQSDNGYEAAKWESGVGFTALGDLPGGAFESFAFAISDDATIICGFGTTAIGREAAIWRGNGIERAADVLTAAGVTIPPGWLLRAVNDVTINQNVVTICGDGIDALGFSEAWIARYAIAAPPPPCIYDLSHDGIVDLPDLAIVLSQYGCLPHCPGCGNCSADLDADEDVDLVDVAILLSQYGFICP